MEKNGGAGISMLVTLCMAFSFYVANAAGPFPLQDFCIGVNDHKSSVFVNGKFCKDPKTVTVEDFLYKGFDVPGNTSNSIVGATAFITADDVFPAVNTLGVSMGRIDFGPFGLNVPHLHPRASEIFNVLEGTLYIGLVTTDNKLFDAVIGKGDVVVFPQGLIHFQLNVGITPALAIAGFGSQNPGRTDIATALFGTEPPIFNEVLTKAFQVGESVIPRLQDQFPYDEDSVEKGRSLLKLLMKASYT